MYLVRTLYKLIRSVYVIDISELVSMVVVHKLGMVNDVVDGDMRYPR